MNIQLAQKWGHQKNYKYQKKTLLVAEDVYHALGHEEEVVEVTCVSDT